LFKLFAAAMARLPLPVALAMGRGLGRFFGLVVARQRRRALAHLAQCLPEKSDAERRAICRRMFANLGMNTIEMFRWIGGAESELQTRIRFDGTDTAREALARGRGVLVLTAHIGNFDLMGLWAASRYPLTIISKDLKNEALNTFWMEKRARAGLKIVPAHNSYRACLSVLKRGECLGFILDQNMTRKEGIFVNFFGRPACTTPGLAVLSAHAGAPVLPIFIVRGPGGLHEIKVGRRMDPPADRTPASIAQATEEYTSVIENMVRAYPDQWIWMHRRWRTQPGVPAQKDCKS
jgi:KDO2-lipid IV(A) lauroyltransferase